MSMTASRAVLIAACLACAPAMAANAAELSLTIRDGRVTLVAKDVTVRQILAEWARVGKTTVVNLDRVPGGPMSVELRDVPEARALDTVLRSVAGFLAARRPVPEPGASEFHRIVVMPVLAPAQAALPAAGGVRQGNPPPSPALRPQGPFRPDSPFSNRRRPGDPADESENADEADPDADETEAPPAFPGRLRPPGTVYPGPNQPGMTPQPGEPVANPDEPAAPAFQPGRVPTGPVGASAPGMVVPAPQQNRPGQPPGSLPVKPPGDPR